MTSSTLRGRRIRSLHVSDLAEGGGAEAVFADVVRSAKSLGHEVTTLVSDGRRTPVSYVFSTRWYREMRERLRSHDPDIVHLHNFYHYLSPSVLLAIRHHRGADPSRPQVVFTAHDYHLVCPNSVFQHFPGGVPTAYDRTAPRVPLIARFDQRSLVHGALKAVAHMLAYRVLRLRSEIDFVITPSEHLRGTFAKAGITAPSEVIRNPVQGLDRAREPRGSRTAADSVALVSLGRVETGKGLEELLESLDDTASQPDTPHVSLDIYGTGDAESAIARRAATMKHVQVRLMGRDPRSEVPRVLEQYDGFVFPSIWPENAPVSVIEAAVVGLPVLVSHELGASEMARQTTEWVELDPRDPSSVGEALRALRAVSGPNTLVTPDDFTEETFRRRLDEVYDRLAGMAAPQWSADHGRSSTPRGTGPAD